MGVKTFSVIVILAGGIGERLWPASVPENPKQFLSVDGKLSFLQSSKASLIAFLILILSFPASSSTGTTKKIPLFIFNL